MPADLVRLVDRLVPGVAQTLAGPPDRTMDCRVACSVWAQALGRQGVRVETTGGEGVDDDVFLDYRARAGRAAQRLSRGGFRVHRHYC